MLITFDGIDGGGKSTQIRMLKEYLEATGVKTRFVRDPGSTPAGDAIREILLHRTEIEISPMTEMLLYMAARSQLVNDQIRPGLSQGELVISDRFLLANVVYQGCGGLIDPEVIWNVGEIATGGLRPDLTILLDLPVEVAMMRIGQTKDRLENRSFEYFERVRAGFLSHLDRSCMRSIHVDATQSVEVIHQRVIESVNDLRIAE